MILNLSEIEDGKTLECEVCIIGAGVAGQTLSQTLADAGIDVILCESGKRDFDQDIQNLARGQNTGEKYYDLHDSRLRLFGGTAAIWGGRCAELDAIDFEKRTYIPHSGWPINKRVLDPYYEKTFASLGLKRPSSKGLWDEAIKTKNAFNPEKLDSGIWSFDEDGERFTNPNRGALKKVKRILEATLTALGIDESGGASGHIEAAQFMDLAQNSIRIKAKKFVLAAGAMETIRLLMGGVPSRPDGLGNTHGQLGRFFMEHPHARGGQIISPDMTTVMKALPRAIRYKKQRYATYLRPSDALQREEKILNSSLSFACRRHEGLQLGLSRSAKDKLKHDLPSTKLWRSVYRANKNIGIKIREKTDPWKSVRKLQRKPDTFGIYAIIRAEQAPNPNSRLRLSDEIDLFGLRKLEFDWQLQDIDKRSVRILMETLNKEFQSLGWGQVLPAPWLNNPDMMWSFDPLISPHFIGGYHHMGGTRMSNSEKTGVVDMNCKLHESSNLYIASSSVFPTGGWANPTITIMALASRLGDHLIGTLR